mmetsp:Transcript_10763/g.13054  ORF Transcript_10763/g.13054 Transcript_10763/m.13054 type:complete len:119 (+) Transcript_10763:50-406(+)|eukprot:CAMPEP_0114336174 /NCGR_PEP_ID=MMETSP0101-20121206/5531_1 /TAXON_ID=38822 ORGANISM="Pteridomonas danica, Strain PT" /NCGR_SAMPLE_ID=MMETSP0101 /ASSEMBLY_ACC=CAM_ASM_000211 /LENGTH=118 /DNA_ID=CAMNT_0001468009 /DNA_START=69 /DNA_END=425 /DNA_ORIENTATION=+
MKSISLFIFFAQILAVSSSFYICDSGNPKFIGHFVEDAVADGSPKYVNEEGMSIFRHQGYWYLGDMAPWPPVTHYRCIEGCGYNSPTPPLNGYQPKKNIGESPAPILQEEPCVVNDEL